MQNMQDSIVYDQLEVIRDILMSGSILVKDSLVIEASAFTRHNRVLVQEVLESFNLVCFRSLKLCLLNDLTVYTSQIQSKVSMKCFVVLERVLPRFMRINILDANFWLGTVTFNITINMALLDMDTSSQEDLGYFLYRYITMFKGIRKSTEGYFLSKVYETNINVNTKNIKQILNNLVLDCIFKVEFGKSTFSHVGDITLDDKSLLKSALNIQVEYSKDISRVYFIAI